MVQVELAFVFSGIRLDSQHGPVEMIARTRSLHNIADRTRQRSAPARRQQRNLFPLVIAAVPLLLHNVILFAGASGPCTPHDPSASFTTHLSLPDAGTLPWTTVRKAIAQGRYPAADALLRAAPASADRWLWRGVLLLHQRRTFGSIRTLEQAARLHESSQVETLLAVDYFLLNQRILAGDSLDRALRLHPRDAMALYLRGRLEFVSGNLGRAFRDFRATLSQEPDDYHALYYLGLSGQRMGQNAAARKYLLHSIAVLTCQHLNFPLAPYTLAGIDLDAGVAAEALKQANLALTMAESPGARNSSSEEIAKILVARGKIEDHLGHRADADRDLEQAVKLNPYLAEGWYWLAHVCREQGKTAQAARALEQFQKIQNEL